MSDSLERPRWWARHFRDLPGARREGAIKVILALSWIPRCALEAACDAADADGVIELRGYTLHGVIGRAVGATKDELRTLRAGIAILYRDGLVTVTPGNPPRAKIRDDVFRAIDFSSRSKPIGSPVGAPSEPLEGARQERDGGSTGARQERDGGSRSVATPRNDSRRPPDLESDRDRERRSQNQTHPLDGASPSRIRKPDPTRARASDPGEARSPAWYVALPSKTREQLATMAALDTRKDGRALEQWIAAVTDRDLASLATFAEVIDRACTHAVTFGSDGAPHAIVGCTSPLGYLLRCLEEASEDEREPHRIEHRIDDCRVARGYS